MKKVFLVTILFLIVRLSYSQCSDAGVCTLGAHKTELRGNNSSINFQYSNSGSGSPDNVKYNLFKLGGSFAFTKNISLSFSIPYLIQKNDQTISDQSGVLFEAGKTYSGLGDMIALAEYNIEMSKSNILSFQAGAKINTASDKFKYYNAYGTNDLLIGVNYFMKNINAGISTQIPLNEYKLRYEDFPNQGEDFKRGADISARVGYSNNIEKLNYKLELIGIKRLSKSVYTYYPILAVEIPPYTVPESDFFQLNVSGTLAYSLSKNFDSELNFAIPLLKRDENSDGTKRAYTVQAGIRYNFKF